MEPRTSLRGQQREFTRSRLLSAAAVVFARRGYAATTVDDIALEAGASRATFYLHFKSKTQLVGDLLTSSIDYALDRYHVLDDMLSSEGPTSTGELRSWLAEWLQVWRQATDTNRALMQAAAVEPEVDRRMLDVSSQLIDALEQYLAAIPAVQRKRVRDYLLVLEIMTQRIFALASRRELPIDDEGLLDILADLWFTHFVAARETRHRPRAGKV